MLEYTQIVIDHFDSRELKYDIHEISEDAVLIRVTLDNVTASIFFNGEKGEYVSLYYFLGTVSGYGVKSAVEKCNEINKRYKWLKFYVDDDNELTAQDDCIITAGNAGEEVFELLLRAMKIIGPVKGTYFPTCAYE